MYSALAMPSDLAELGGGLRPDQVLHHHRRDVEGVAQGVQREHRTVLLDVGVRRPVGRLLGQPELRHGVDEHRGHGGVTRLECRGVRDRLEGRSRLAPAEPGHVELALDPRILAIPIVDAAHVRDDLAGGRVDGNQRRVVHVEAGQGLHPLRHQPLRLLLERQVEGRLDSISAGENLERRIRHTGQGAKDPLGLLADPEAEMRLAQDARETARVHLEPRGVARDARLGRRDVALLDHRADDEIALTERICRRLLGVRVAHRVLVGVEE